MSPPLESPAVAPSAGQLAGLLADADRRRIVAAIVLGAQSVDDVCRAAGLTLRKAVTATGRLVDGGLVEQAADGALVLAASAFSAAARAAAPVRRENEHAGQPAEVARVLRAHVKDDRLTSIPSSHAKRLIVLALIVEDFELDTHYLEPEVNTILAHWHPDTAALRRWLVDVGYLDRDHGDYWRCGGPVTLSTQYRTETVRRCVESRGCQRSGRGDSSTSR